VAGSVKHVGAEREPRPTLYVSYRQHAAERMTLVLRTAGPPMALVHDAKSTIWNVDGDIPVYRVETMEDVVAETTSAPRLTLALLAAFAAAALGLASLGVFGVAAYTVNQRTREIGIRMALGARQADVLRMIVGQGLVPVAVGEFAGLGAALILMRLMAGMFFGESYWDPAVFGGVMVFLGTVSLAACWFPAQRAARIDPMIVLREE
jgi:putative ABC transport system permease protein